MSSNSTPKKITPDTWNAVWGLRQDNWDFLSETVLDRLNIEIPNGQGQIILEAGSGTGRISLKLSKKGYKVFLLDYSLKALSVSSKLFSDSCHEHRHAQGSIFQMPFQNEAFDVVWNSGVIEHYYEKEQNVFFSEAARVLKKEGVFVTLNPYKKSVLHNIGKKFIEKNVKYPYGLEMPIESIQYALDNTGLEFVHKEYSIGFILLFVGMFKRLQLLPLGKGFRAVEIILNKLFIGLYHTPLRRIFVALDRMLSKIFGGYLLVSVARKTN